MGDRRRGLTEARGRARVLKNRPLSRRRSAAGPPRLATLLAVPAAVAVRRKRVLQAARRQREDAALQGQLDDIGRLRTPVTA